jgi:hypothetical protein
MKLIIDIPEDVRIAISRMGLLRIPDEMQTKVDKAIQHGTPLDNVRAKIEEIETYDGLYIDRAYVLQIIDKYKAERSDKE